MSKMEFLTGKLIHIGPKALQTLEDVATIILAKENHQIDYETAVECLQNEFYREYVIVLGKIYKVEMSTKDANYDVFQASKNEDGTISFTLKYYNGGCSFNEAIERALK